MVLAAGESQRMGFPKALLPLGAQTFLTRVLATLGGLGYEEPCVVLGAHAERIQPLLRNSRARVVINQDFRSGQLSSIKVALRDQDENCGACMIWPVDQPAISGSVVKELVQLFLNSHAALVLPQCQGRRGHPAIFSKELFPELLEASLQEGGRAVVLRNQDRMALLPTEDASTISDIDTPDDYYKLTGETLKEALRRRGRSQEPE